MTDQERKMRILNRLKAAVYFLLGITVLFLSIQSIIQAHGKLGSILANIIWLILSLIIIVEGIITVKNILMEIPANKRILHLSDWCIVIAGVIIANSAYMLHNNSVLLLGIVMFIAGCIPINDSPRKKK